MKQKINFPLNKVIGELSRFLGQVEVAISTLTSKQIKPGSKVESDKILPEKVGTLKGKTAIISGGSRGIGLEVAKRFARDGANIVIAAKSTESHPKLAGTIFSAADEIKALGGQALPIKCDVRNEDEVKNVIESTNKTFGGIDIVINNASAISLSSIENTELKKFDLMFDINVRGTYLLSKLALPYLINAKNPHILTFAPPINLDGQWFDKYGTYTTSKYAMALVAKSLAHEMNSFGVASSCLWPRTTIATAAVLNMSGGQILENKSRRPEIMADAAYEIVTRKSKDFLGQSFIDDEVLTLAGIKDLTRYAVNPTQSLQQDLFLS